MSDEDWAKELEDDDGKSSYYIPKNSTLNVIKSNFSSVELETKQYVSNLHNYNMTLERTHITKKYKSFESIHIEEDSLRYYQDKIVKDQQEGLKLATILSQENSSDSTLEYIRAHVQTYINSYKSLYTSTRSFQFPWATYDDSVQHSCYNFIAHKQYDECRAYTIGYFECLSRLPTEIQSAQGKVFMNSIGWATGRHPFGSYITVLILGMRSLLQRVRLELNTGLYLCHKLKYIIDSSATLWLSR